MGNFVHIELNTKNARKAKSFYSKVFGWKLIDVPMPGGAYTMVDGLMNPGIGLQKAPDPNLPSCWVAYIEVDDIKKTVAAATKAGAQAVVPFMEVPGPNGSVMGQLAWLVDPTGATFAIWRSVAPPPQTATKKKATKKKATKKKATKKKATKKKATKKKAAKKKATKKKAAKKKTTKRAPARKKRVAKKR